MFDATKYAKAAALTDQVLVSWPEHATYIARSFQGRDDELMAVSDSLSAAVIARAADVAGGLATLCDDYRYMCEQIILPEELYFRRNGDYRLKTAHEANEECYSNGALMGRYMNGLAISNVIWDNHAHAFSAFVNGYLPHVPDGARHLEIGPGHGFFLYFAAASARIAALTGWDVSPTSIADTRETLAKLGVAKPLELKVQDLFEAGRPQPGSSFDSIVMSEVLEHIEDPHAALRAASAWLSPAGRIWINVPINSPAPDHIYLFRDIDEACAMVRDCGLDILDHAAFPISGVTLEKAIKRKQTISCVITAARPARPDGEDHGTR